MAPSRRRFLGIVLIVVLTASAVLVAIRERLLRGMALLVKRLVPSPELDASKAPGAISPNDRAGLRALAEVLVPPGHDDAIQALLREHVEDRALRVPGALAEYRAGILLLDETARRRYGGTFAALDRSRREDVLKSLLWAYRGRSAIAPLLERLTSPRRVLALRELVVRDLLTAFYRSPAGWALVGYAHFPGVPAADPLDYARPPRA